MPKPLRKGSLAARIVADLEAGGYIEAGTFMGKRSISMCCQWGYGIPTYTMEKLIQEGRVKRGEDRWTPFGTLWRWEAATPSEEQKEEG